MHAWRNDVYHCGYAIALYSNCLNPISDIFRGSAVGSALDLESKGCWFEPTVRHYFFFQQCSPVVIAIFTDEDPQPE